MTIKQKILWLVAFMAALVFAAQSVNVILGPPPLPPVKKKRAPAAIHQGAGAAKLIQKAAVIRPAGKLVWDAPPSTPGNPLSNLVYLVMSSDRVQPTRDGYTKLEGTTASLTWPLLVDTSVAGKFFIVKSSNIITGLVSQ